MKITKTSVLTNITRTKEINITLEELHRWKSGELIQNVVPYLSTYDREFLINGTTKEEWDKFFTEDNEE